MTRFKFTKSPHILSLSHTHTHSHTHTLQIYEKIVHLHKKTMARLPDTRKALSSFTMPTTVKDAEHLMQDELQMKEKLINLFAESELKMDEFLTSLNEQQSHTHSSVVSSRPHHTLTPSHTHTHEVYTLVHTHTA